MKVVHKYLGGDIALWVLLVSLAIFSFLPVFSASTNLAYVVGSGTPMKYLLKHFMIVLSGFAFMIMVHKIPYQYFKGLSILFLPFVFFLLIYTATQGQTIGGANASRWLKVPFIGVSFQTSTMAGLVMKVYAAFYFTKLHEVKRTFKYSLLRFWVPLFFILLLILISNFSTAALLFISVIVLACISGYSLRELLKIFGISLALLLLFFLVVKAFPDKIPNRVDTWVSRIERFTSPSSDTIDNYQTERAKTAIATGDVFGLGAGKSVMKNFLPQSSSDFIYAIIVEEYGLLGGVGLILVYLMILFRLVLITRKCDTTFGKLLVIGIGFSIVFQAFVNMGVAVNLLPVTGQTLPMISSGGTAIWMTCIAFGIIQSVSSDTKEEEKDKYSKQENPLSILSETI